MLRGRDPGSVPDLIQLVAPHHVTTSQCLLRQPGALRERRIVQPELTEPALCTRNDARRQDGEDPSNVVGCDEVQRSTHRPCPNDRAARDSLLDGQLGCHLGAKPDRPEAAEVVLCLHGAEPSNDIGRISKRRAADVLVRQPDKADVHDTTWAFSCATSASSIARKQCACVIAVSVRSSTSSTS